MESSSSLEQFPGAEEEENFIESNLSSPGISEVGFQKKSGGQLKAGYLNKEGKKVKSWKRRWFVLTPTTLSYYRDQKSKVCINKISLADCLSIEMNPERAEANYFEIVTTDRPFCISANSELDQEEWIFALKYALQQYEEHKVELEEEAMVRTLTMTISDNLSIISNEKNNVKSGFLVKQGNSIKSWKKRWFVLTENSFSYYLDPSDEKPIRDIPLSQCLHIGPCEQIKKFCFGFVTIERIFYMCAESETEMNEWITSISTQQQSLSSKRPSTDDSESRSSGESQPSFDSSSLRKSSAGMAQKSGYLTKEGGKIKTWKKRWFVCSGNKLSYYGSNQSKSPIDIINLEKCTAVLDSNFDKSMFGFEIVLPQRTYRIACETKEERAEWTKVLRTVIASV